MLYVLHGNNSIEKTKKLKSMTDAMQKKRPDAELFRLKGKDIANESDSLDSLLHSVGLFEQKYIIVVDEIDGEAQELLLKKAKDMKESNHVCIVVSDKLLKKELDTFEKFAEKVQEFSEVKKTAERFNTFALADAFGKRDKKSLWIGLLNAYTNDIAPEEIAGVLFWQVKNIVLAHKTNSAGESKLSPFVDGNARRFAKNYTLTEILKISDGLVNTTVQTRAGLGEMEVLLEKWVLGL